MIFSLAMTGILLVQSAAQGPSPDEKPGMGRLEAIADAVSGAAPFYATASVISREDIGRSFFEARSMEIWCRDSESIRLHFSDMWGDGSRFILNKTELLHDPLDISQGVTLKSVPALLWEGASQLGPRGSNGSPFLYLTAGRVGAAALTPEKSQTTEIDPAGPFIGVQIVGSPFGTMRIYYRESDQRKLPVVIEYDNRDAKQAIHELYPDWVDAPSEGTLDIELIRYHSIKRPINKTMFDVTPPKGLKVDDQRQKPEKP